MSQNMIVFTAPESFAPLSENTLVANGQIANRPAAIELPALAFDQMIGLTEAELKVALFIVRQTLGYTRECVTLTYSQIVYGTYADDGRLLDRGTGLCHKSVGRAVRLLVDKGYIQTTNTGRPRRNVSGAPTDPALPTGTAAIYSLGKRLRLVRNWYEQPRAKPMPEARHGIKTPMPA